MGQGQSVWGKKDKSKWEHFICFPHPHSNLTPSRNSSERLHARHHHSSASHLGWLICGRVSTSESTAVFSEIQQPYHSFAKQFFQQSGFSYVSCSLRSLHRFIAIWLWIFQLLVMGFLISISPNSFTVCAPSTAKQFCPWHKAAQVGKPKCSYCWPCWGGGKNCEGGQEGRQGPKSWRMPVSWDKSAQFLG